MTVSLTDYNQFLNDFETFAAENNALIKQSMSNVFSMRLIGNKTHGDLAEVALAQLIEDHMDGYVAKHIGKASFRAKSSEEDIAVTTPTGAVIPISLKAYGVGPLQLSTNKECNMFPMLDDFFNERQPVGEILRDPDDVKAILSNPIFSDFHRINVFPLIYDEKRMRYNIMIFDARKAYDEATEIHFVRGEGRRKHPVYKFSALLPTTSSRFAMGTKLPTRSSADSGRTRFTRRAILEVLLTGPTTRSTLTW